MFRRGKVAKLGSREAAETLTIFRNRESIKFVTFRSFYDFRAIDIRVVYTF